MINLRYANRTRAKISVKKLEAIVQKVLIIYRITDNVEVELEIIGTDRMRRLNRTYRAKDYATDVLSFPIWPDLATIRMKQLSGPVSLGSIALCLPVAKQAAAAEDQSLEAKIGFLVEHGLKHLLGFHHKGD